MVLRSSKLDDFSLLVLPFVGGALLIGIVELLVSFYNCQDVYEDELQDAKHVGHEDHSLI
jgi:hypothetical protein